MILITIYHGSGDKSLSLRLVSRCPEGLHLRNIDHHKAL